MILIIYTFIIPINSLIELKKDVVLHFEKFFRIENNSKIVKLVILQLNQFSNSITITE